MKNLLRQQFFLTTDPDPSWPVLKKAIYYFYREALLICSGISMGITLLLLALGPYAARYFTRFALPEYFTQKALLFLNVIPVILLILLCYGITGRAWSAFLLGSTIPYVLSLSNYYKIWFRDDPLYFEDLLFFREAANMIMGQKYSLFVDKWVLITIINLIFITLILYLFSPWQVKKAEL